VGARARVEFRGNAIAADPVVSEITERMPNFSETINEPVAEVFQKLRKVLKLSIRL